MELLKYMSRPKFHSPALAVCWESDAGQLGAGVLQYIRRELGGEAFCEIDPGDFFPLSGVAIESDVVMFPESTFYALPDRELVIFYSTIPRYEWFRFLNLVVDVAHDCHAREMYTIGGMIALGPHTSPRDFWATFSTPQIKKSLASYGLSRELDFETPPGGRPTLNSFMLWTAKQRDLPGANLWVPVPFYLVGVNDPKSHRKVLEFMDSRLGLGLSLARLDAEIRRQEEKIARLRREQPDIESIISRLENNVRLSEEEHEKLTKEVEEYLRKNNG
jgi:proteasome assembly chaperone (PAC2) family protein